MIRNTKRRPSYIVKTDETHDVTHAYKLDRYGNLIPHPRNHMEYIESKDRVFKLSNADLRRKMGNEDFNVDEYFGVISEKKVEPINISKVSPNDSKADIDDLFKDCFNLPLSISQTGDIFDDDFFFNFY